MLLHFKDDTPNLTVNDIYLIYDNLLKISLDKNKNEPLLEFIYCEADKISENDSSYIKLEEKLTLAIATRLIAEKFMINNIQDNSPINSNQTRELFNKFENEHPDYEKLNVLETVHFLLYP